MIRKAFRLGVGVVVVLVLAGLVSGPARADHLDQFQGSWRIVAAKVGKIKATGEVKHSLELIVEGDKLTLIEGPKKEVVHISLTPGKKSHSIDFYKSSAKKEKVWHGIYEFDGKDLKMCWGPAGHPRPHEFKTTAKTQNRYYVFRKE